MQSFIKHIFYDSVGSTVEKLYLFTSMKFFFFYASGMQTYYPRASARMITPMSASLSN